MVDKKDERSTVDEFVLEKIDTVPEIEALLLIWNKRPKVWSVSEMASALYISRWCQPQQALVGCRKQSICIRKTSGIENRVELGKPHSVKPGIGR